MINKIEELIKLNKLRLEEYEKEKRETRTEYQEALYEGMISELESSISDLEELLK